MRKWLVFFFPFSPALLARLALSSKQKKKKKEKRACESKFETKNRQEKMQAIAVVMGIIEPLGERRNREN